MKALFTLIILVLSTSISFSQSLKGKAKLNRASAESSGGSNVVIENSSKTMRYGNVLAYDKDNNLVGSVLTDEEGNYQLNFKDTGTYNIKIMYAGYETIEESIMISGDGESDFSLDRNKLMKERVLSERAYSLHAGYLDAPVFFSIKKTQNGASKSKEGLTSGEINDFAKWDLWNDYLKTDLLSYQETWRLNPQNRYVVQLFNLDKMALVGASVSLLNGSGMILWQAVTDNTGKAELWGSIDGTEQKADKIIVDYQGETKEIRNPKLFKKGINTVKMDQSCGANNLVEIAFVVDATGSMADEINFIKRDLNTVMYNAQNLYSDVSINYGSVFYRDSGEDYITKHKDFTNVLSEALVFVDEQFAKGGGDMPEAVDAGLDVAINQLSWSENARTKLLFLILDAPAHTGEENIKKLQELTAQAAEKGIKIIPVTGSGINKSGEYLMRSLALATNGTYVFLTNHSGIGSTHIEPTIDEYEVKLLTERLSNIIKTNIYYPECEELVPDFDTDYPDSVVTFTEENGQIYPLRTDTLSTREQDSLNNIADNEIKQIEWRYYPNPTRDYINIECSEEIEFIYLTDLTGKILQKVEFGGRTQIQLYLGDYPVGVYLLRYPVGKQWVSGKVILIS